MTIAELEMSLAGMSATLGIGFIAGALDLRRRAWEHLIGVRDRAIDIELARTLEQSTSSGHTINELQPGNPPPHEEGPPRPAGVMRRWQCNDCLHHGKWQTGDVSWDAMIHARQTGHGPTYTVWEDEQ